MCRNGLSPVRRDVFEAVVMSKPMQEKVQSSKVLKRCVCDSSERVIKNAIMPSVFLSGTYSMTRVALVRHPDPAV